jgi:hypothetical protein
MANSVLSGLIARRAELVTEVKKQEAVLRGLLADIDHLDAAARHFDQAHRARRPHTSIGRLERGSMTKALLTILRTATAPMTIRDLTAKVMVIRGMDAGDRKRANQMMEQVRTAIGRQRKHGTVTGEPGPGGPFEAWVWRISK